jgi:hypothetical protein
MHHVSSLSWWDQYGQVVKLPSHIVSGQSEQASTTILHDCMTRHQEKEARDWGQWICSVPCAPHNKLSLLQASESCLSFLAGGGDGGARQVASEFEDSASAAAAASARRGSVLVVLVLVRSFGWLLTAREHLLYRQRERELARLGCYHLIWQTD